MNLEFAVERLAEAGWSPAEELELERLPDGRGYPSVLTVQKRFAEAGLELSIKHNLMFNCYRATWRRRASRLIPATLLMKSMGPW